MPASKAVRLIHVAVRLGGVPDFRIDATGEDGELYRVEGAGAVEGVALFQEFLDQLKASYPSSASVTICVDESVNRIVRPANCGGSHSASAAQPKRARRGS